MTDENLYQAPAADLQGDHPSTVQTVPPRVFTFAGRLGRVRYLAYSTVAGVASIAGGIAAGVATSGMTGAVSLSATMAVTVAALLVSVMLTMQRVHDFDLSGWLAVLVIVPIVGLLFSIALWFIPGTPTANRYGPPIRPNTAGAIALAALGPILLVGGGILAAIAIPAYQDYTQRAQVSQALTAAAPAQAFVAEFGQTHGRWPGRVDIESVGRFDAAPYGQIGIEPDSGIVTVVMVRDGTVGPAIAGKKIYFSPVVDEDGGHLRFECQGPNIAAKFLPRACRGDM